MGLSILRGFFNCLSIGSVYLTMKMLSVVADTAAYQEFTYHQNGCLIFMIDCHVILSLRALPRHRSNYTRASLSEQRVKSSRILGMWWDISTTYSVIIYNRAHLVVFCLQIHSPMSSNMATTHYWCWDDRGTQNFMSGDNGSEHSDTLPQP